MTWDLPRPFLLAVTPEAADIDGLQHTNNAVYVQWCERIGWAHSAALGLTLDDYRTLDRAMAIRHGAYDYLLPTLEGEALTLATWLVSDPAKPEQKLSMTRRFQLMRDRDQATVMRGQWELVCIELSTGRPRRMPPAFCEAYLAAAVPVATPVTD